MSVKQGDFNTMKGKILHIYESHWIISKKYKIFIFRKSIFHFSENKIIYIYIYNRKISFSIFMHSVEFTTTKILEIFFTHACSRRIVLKCWIFFWWRTAHWWCIKTSSSTNIYIKDIFKLDLCMTNRIKIIGKIDIVLLA